MANLLNPPGIIFINSNLHPFVLGTLEHQLYITRTMTGEEFDHHIDGYGDGYMDENDYLGDGYISDGYYSAHIRGRDERILVLRDLNDYTNRALADLVLCYRYGLLYVETSKYGPPGKAIRLQNAYILDLTMH